MNLSSELKCATCGVPVMQHYKYCQTCTPRVNEVVLTEQMRHYTEICANCKHGQEAPDGKCEHCRKHFVRLPKPEFDFENKPPKPYSWA